MYYTPGMVSGRWIGFGGGAAICILRVQLSDRQSGRLLGDIVGTYQVQSGGLFTVGADEQVPKTTARLLAGRILELVGLGGAADASE